MTHRLRFNLRVEAAGASCDMVAVMPADLWQLLILNHVRLILQIVASSQLASRLVGFPDGIKTIVLLQRECAEVGDGLLQRISEHLNFPAADAALVIT